MFETIVLTTIAAIAVIVSFAVLGTIWFIYYKQYVEPYGWFKPVHGKVSYLAATAICSLFWYGFVYYLIDQAF